MMMIKKMILGLVALMMGCQVVMAQKSIVILYENDVHCGIDGYTKLAGLRDAINKRIRPMRRPCVVATSFKATPQVPSRRDSTLPISCAIWTITR